MYNLVNILVQDLFQDFISINAYLWYIMNTLFTMYVEEKKFLI